jgi:methyl-accepting chemotaxis protein
MNTAIHPEDNQSDHKDGLRLAALVSKFLPPSYRALDNETQRKTYLTAQFATLFSVLGMSYVPPYLILGVPLFAALTGSFGAVCFIALLGLRQGFSIPVIASVITLAANLLIIALSIIVGSGWGFIASFFPVIPIIALLLVSQRASVFWGVVVTIEFIALWYITTSGYVFTDILPKSFAPYFPLLCIPTVILINLSLSLMFERNRAATLQALEAEKASVEKRVETAVQENMRQQEEMRAIEAEIAATMREQQQYLEASARTILDAMQRFAFGDLTVAVEDNKREDDISKIFRGFNRSISAVRKLVEQVIHNVEQTTAIAAHISSASSQMAATSEEQSAQIAEIASNVETMARSVHENSLHATQMNKLTKQTGDNALQGAHVVGSAIEKIQHIAAVVNDATTIVSKLGDSSAQIGEIVQVIEEIADQTNLLALNAAIEAARAGEQGRGFAVVADEVRKLAERTATATKQISQTIKQIQHDTENAVHGMKNGNTEVQEGLSLARQAGDALDNIVRGTQEVQQMVQASTLAMEQQSSNSEEISKSIDQIAASVEETTASLSEIAHSTETLRALTESLQNLVSQFDIGESKQLNHQLPQQKFPQLA